MRKNHRMDVPAAQLVTSADELERVCDVLSATDRLAFDAEFITEESFDPELCLLQVATGNDVWLIDPLAGVDVRPFWELIADQPIEVIVHAGFEDLGICFQQVGRVPSRVFDVQIAAGWVGLSYPLSLQKLVRAVSGVVLHKTQTLTDWRRRPLSPEQLRYAAEDVAYLPAIHSFIRSRLAAKGRREWADEEFARYSDPRTYQQGESELLWRVKGVGSLSGRELAVAKQLALERKKLARQYNRPLRSVLKDHLLVAIARHGWSDRKALRSLRGVNLKGEALDALCDAVRRGLDSPREQWPKPSRADELTVQEVTLCKFVSAVLHDFCRKERIAYGLLATRRDIERLVLAHTRPGDSGASGRQGALQQGWRGRSIGDLVGNLLSGAYSVRVDTSPGGPRLVVE